MTEAERAERDRIERERRELFDQLNGQGRLLQNRSLADAAELNRQLRLVVDWLVARATKKT